VLAMLMRRLMGNRAVPSIPNHLSDVCLMLRCLARMVHPVTNYQKTWSQGRNTQPRRRQESDVEDPEFSHSVAFSRPSESTSSLIIQKRGRSEAKTNKPSMARDKRRRLIGEKGPKVLVLSTV
jgi:hypothetical protein